MILAKRWELDIEVLVLESVGVGVCVWCYKRNMTSLSLSAQIPKMVS